MDDVKPFQALKTQLYDWASAMHRTIWNNVDVGRVTKILWGNANENETRKLLRRSELWVLIGILMGHSVLLSHLLRIGVVESGICRTCEEDEETLQHYLCNCPAFAEIRYSVPTLSRDPISLEDLKGTGW